MAKSVKSVRSIAICSLSVLMAGTLAAAQIVSIGGGAKGDSLSSSATKTASIKDVTGQVKVDTASLFNEDVVKKLPEGLSGDREISVIVSTSDETLVSAFKAQNSFTRYNTVSDFADSTVGSKIVSSISTANSDALRRLKNAGVSFKQGASYNTLLGGFEVVVKAKEYEKIVSALSGTSATAYISEEYEVSEAQLVTNDVNIDTNTGIFNNTSDYDGTGTVVAVLDTGCDYFHAVFDNDVFLADYGDRSKLAMTRDTLAEKMGDLKSFQELRNITAADVYINEKIPYGYDYADHDVDVYPLDEAHGTHVAGVILGDNRGAALKQPDDPEIVGVATKAQLAVMKVFSDRDSGARWSWIVSALEDCVHLGVDVINMSLGSSAGFTEESDVRQAYVYDMIEAAGISLVCAASNDYTSTFGSEKNGNLGLTTNPDSATVGSPSTYNAALSVASISGVKTPYLLYNNEIFYFTESANASAEPKKFVDELFDIIDPSLDELEIEYVTVPGIGRSADYNNLDIKGKIALVSRGDNTFEEKARIAMNRGAAGIIVYNNVSGSITMTVGNLKTSDNKPFPACSISQDNGKVLSEHASGKIKISRSQEAGPFMSDFSSWGPTPDLRIKPEITAHGGDILSSVPGQEYERLSGTSMACPNQAGVTALVRQYVKEHASTFGINENSEDYAKQVNAVLNSLMMSTADIANNTNGLPYSVRKQGSGLANLTEATTTPAYIRTFARDDENLYEGSRYTDELLSKAKIEVGDDPSKTGRYELKFNINNVSGTALTYDVDAIVMTEGISTTLTYKGDTTVTQEGYLLEGAKVEVTKVEGGTATGNTVTVSAGSTVTVTAYITLGDSDIKYLEQTGDKSRINANGETEFIPVFDNGMYIEGYVTLTAKNGTTIDLNVPYLAFYGDWTQAPMFDLDYFETDRDDMNDSILNPLDKTLPDAYATTPIGGLSGDYISYLGAYYFVQDSATKMTGNAIYAQREHVALSNNTNSVNQIYAVYAGMLRAAKKMYMTITDSTTGEVIWSKVEENQRKSAGSGGTISPSSVEVKFKLSEHNLKENTQYIFKLEGEMDYGDGGLTTNRRNTFEFPFVVDSTAPVLQNVEYYTTYDRATQKTHLYARLYIYDNHYAMSMYTGTTSYDVEYDFALDNFTRIPTPIYSEFNSTSVVTYELTDYIESIRGAQRGNTFYVALYDYAMNSSIFEIDVPDDILYVHFTEDSQLVYERDAEGNITDAPPTLSLSPNERYTLAPEVYPSNQWRETLQYVSDNTNVVRVVGNKLFAVPPEGENNITRETTVRVYAQEADPATDDPLATLKVRVLAVTDEGYRAITKPVADEFSITGLYVNKAFYFLSYSDRDIGMTGDTLNFSGSGSAYGISMYPSEQVTVLYEDGFKPYFEDETTVVFESSDDSIATVNEDGMITAMAEGIVTIGVSVLQNGRPTLFSGTIYIEVKDPIERNGPYLMGWRGMPDENGVVYIDEDLGFTDIYQYAFSHYDYITKDPWDEISDDDPFYSKTWYKGENELVKKVVIPEGVEVIGAYAFAGMENLEEVVLPKSLKQIKTGAFMGCTSLKTINLENVKFIGQDAFAPGVERDDDDVAIGFTSGVPLHELNFQNIIAIGNRAFEGVSISSLVLNLPASAQSIGEEAFAGATQLVRVSINAKHVKFGAGAFANCARLTTIENFNTTVIPDDLFSGCRNLRSIRFGESVEMVGANAFAGTGLTTFDTGANQNFRTALNGTVLLSGSDSECELVMLAPSATFSRTFSLTGVTVTKIGKSAFAQQSGIQTVNLPDVTEIGEYAFYGSSATKFDFGKVTKIGDCAFMDTTLTELPDASYLATADGVEIGAYAFAGSFNTANLVLRLGNNVKIGDYAFAYNSRISAVEIGNNAVIGMGAFVQASRLSGSLLYADGDAIYRKWDYETSTSNLATVKLGENTTVGDYAFAYNANALTTVTFGNNTTIGDAAFYLCKALRTVNNLAGVTSVGDYAFAGFVTYVTMNSYVVIDYYADGSPASQVRSNRLTSLDLSGAQSIGYHAFAFNANVKSVKLNPNTFAVKDAEGNPVLDEKDAPVMSTVSIGGYAFFGVPLNQISGLSTASSIGEYAFGTFTTEAFWVADVPATFGNEFTALDLSGVREIGDYAFADSTKLTSVKLSPNTFTAWDGEKTVETRQTIKEGAFSDAVLLAQAENIKYVQSFGAKAFFNTALEGELDLSGAEEIGEFAFGYLYVEYNANGSTTTYRTRTSDSITGVVLGEGLKVLGDNPFSGREIPLFSTSRNVDFNGIPVDPEYFYTFDVSDNVKVIDGALYRKVENGYVLVTYPIGAEAKEFIVAEGTYTFSNLDDDGNVTTRTEQVEVVRIAARAFQGATIGRVELPSFLKAIGDKAFYGATELNVVVFRSLVAPILEENYDENYMTGGNLAGFYVGYKDGSDPGLGIIPDYTMYAPMWFLGANFDDYIGLCRGDITMIRPKNGTGYDSFLYDQYFGTVFNGPAAFESATLEVYNAIANIKDAAYITLDDEAEVVAVRAMYDALTPEQQGLIDNIDRLTAAESIIAYLKSQQGEGPGTDTPGTDKEPEDDNKDPEKKPEEGVSPTVIALSVVCGVLGALLIVGGVMFYLKTSKKKSDHGKQE